MTKKRFKLRLSKLGNGMITDTQKKEDLFFDKEFLDATLPKTAEWLNELAKDNERLKEEKEIWKSNACSLSNSNSILSNELSIAQEQGYEPSKAYKEYIASIKTEYDKFWENKIKHI